MSLVKLASEGELSLFVFKGTHNSIVNSIRRTILDEVPTFAVEDVEIVSNDSPLYDEVLAHRLGLIPLVTDLKNYNFKESCSCGGIGCALCEVKIVLRSDEEGYVYSSEMRSDDPKIVPADMKIPVTKLLAGKKVEINMKAVLGRGLEHAKWAPAHAYMREGGEGLVLVVEPFGQLGSKEIFNGALDVLQSKLDKLSEAFN